MAFTAAAGSRWTHTVCRLACILREAQGLTLVLCGACADQPGSTDQGTAAGQAFTAIVAATGIISLAVAGTAVAFYKEVCNSCRRFQSPT